MSAREGGLSVAAVLVALAVAHGCGESSTRASTDAGVLGLRTPSLGALSAVSSQPSPLVATRLSVTRQPTNVTVLEKFTLAVQVLDQGGSLVTTYSGPVTVRIANDASPYGNARLSGSTSVSAVNGVATFSDLQLDQAGAGYTLRASASALAAATSAYFIAVM